MSAVERGATDEQALTLGLLSGAFEMVFEKIELNTLLDASGTGAKKLVLQALTESLGEGATTFANMAADAFVALENSQWEQSIERYLQENPDWTRERAIGEALLDAVVEIGWDSVLGLFSGFISAGAMDGVNETVNPDWNRVQSALQSEQDITASVPPPADLEAIAQSDLGETTQNPDTPETENPYQQSREPNATLEALQGERERLVSRNDAQAVPRSQRVDQSHSEPMTQSVAQQTPLQENTRQTQEQGTEGEAVLPETENVRDLLRKLPEGAVKTDKEAQVLSNYRQTLSDLQTQQQALTDINAQIETLSQRETPQNGKRIRQLQKKAAELQERIAVYEAALQKTEVSDLVQGVVKQVRAVHSNRGIENIFVSDPVVWQENSIPVIGKKKDTKYRRVITSQSIDQNVSRTNPGYKKGGPAYRNNCQRCVPTYEMRRRGYDVVAKPAIVDSKGALSPSDPLYSSWSEIFSGARFVFCSGKDGGKAEIIRKMNEWGDGAVAEIKVVWDRTHAHVFVAEQVHGEVRFLDPQNGVINCEHYFTTAINGATMFARIDNLETTDLIQLCIQNRGGE